MLLGATRRRGRPLNTRFAVEAGSSPPAGGRAVAFVVSPAGVGNVEAASLGARLLSLDAEGGTGTATAESLIHPGVRRLIQTPLLPSASGDAGPPLLPIPHRDAGPPRSRRAEAGLLPTGARLPPPRDTRPCQGLPGAGLPLPPLACQAVGDDRPCSVVGGLAVDAGRAAVLMAVLDGALGR